MATRNWTDYFVNNRENLMPIDWDTSYKLTPQERKAILASLQQFQLGESSEGNHLIRLAKAYMQHSGDTDYLPALKLFITEEQRHARDLAHFMQQQDLPCLQQHPVDRIFRFLRRAINLELAIVVLLSAEIIAVSYYKALHDATQSPTLRDICRQILRDEIQHIEFQMNTLAKLRDRRSLLAQWIIHQAQRLLFAGTVIIVWIGHWTVYKAGGFSFAKFIQVNWSRFERTFSPSKILPLGRKE
jgi:hypothetical protein